MIGGLHPTVPTLVISLLTLLVGESFLLSLAISTILLTNVMNILVMNIKFYSSPLVFNKETLKLLI